MANLTFQWVDSGPAVELQAARRRVAGQLQHRIEVGRLEARAGLGLDLGPAHAQGGQHRIPVDLVEHRPCIG